MITLKVFILQQQQNGVSNDILLHCAHILKRHSDNDVQEIYKGKKKINNILISHTIQ